MVGEVGLALSPQIKIRFARDNPQDAIRHFWGQGTGECA